jgi:OOP family OmpA-OmpF porin
VPDRDDECPLVRGEAGAACPGAYPGLVVRAERLVLLRPVALDSAGAADEPTRALLRAVVEALNHRPAMVLEVGAHTDAEGSELENLAESQRRAERVRELLIQAGAPAERVRARGYGEELPIESNSTPEGRAANQRIEVRRVEAGAGGF